MREGELTTCAMTRDRWSRARESAPLWRNTVVRTGRTCTCKAKTTSVSHDTMLRKWAITDGSFSVCSHLQRPVLRRSC